ncbi:DUF7222 domain-containing protein (plasmid) [Bradyrhizobium barranii]|jgi:hypothetical protein|uniref:DUF7222 domain-containing protein n=1 Tax=Bradyrhizobium TaxID=374 RepID=UPI00209D9D47|nr:hypothetical protein [Bradyrhizobium japonicum]MCP1768306.1 hypothetical protein [Bradyrhizobium japonicum]MCP1794467.1 hypothetical protein [Bradyrhizobium japonicum]MCP1811266.1 hypothetical protein [Bradyrhizobium japonicum]MCP1821369.1 hypothetical protein [Bradyrhizobium japonicum]MCP1876404.1 hypothetical protein [Bradyrhizobium japonicum]
MSNRSRQRKSLRIRATSFQSWFNANLKAHARDIARHGADCGFPSISYTSDTVCIFDRFADEIWAMAVADAEEYGHTNVCEMIAGFKRSDMLADYDSFKNLMVWYACEKLAGERE